ncbi:hypothetical protein ColTof4_09851 [Colletotrichum tofieldiae]|nr:hypothetical protein ColTof3_05208 [Colletotrichum tofieldiae]GKT77428.1 hypothetical protein ColTof4_09851 [Colletotrichum tofieldiae]GKT86172.1 hypothetical protein Ct61P_04022 [Colletotrichum tofieldiae]
MNVGATLILSVSDAPWLLAVSSCVLFASLGEGGGGKTHADKESRIMKTTLIMDPEAPGQRNGAIPDLPIAPSFQRLNTAVQQPPERW